MRRALILLPFSLYANPANPNQLDYLEASVNDLKKQVADLKEQCAERQVNPPAAPSINGGYDIFITGDLLYWKASENGLAYVLKTGGVEPTHHITDNAVWTAPAFDWDTGFRVGLGWDTSHDDWDLYFSWTRLHTAAHSHRHAGAGALFATFADPLFTEVPIERASAHLTIHLNVLDFELGRSFYVGKSLSIRPHVGFENAWISQHYNTKYHGHTAFNGNPAVLTDFNDISFRNHFWGIGARAGAHTEWEMRWGLSVCADVALALLHGNFNLKRTSALRHMASTPNITHKSHTDEKFIQARAAMEFFLGAQWDWLFAHDRFHLGIKAGWEQHMYFGQNQIFNPVDSPSTAGKLVSSNDDLTFQGLTFSLRLDL
jgi:hypothetical protein